jgi:hypothetical protein
MAIKGKGRTKTRQPVRAPRRGPVPVPVPFVRRRGVQALAAFVAGLLVFWGGVWLTNGLRAQDRTTRTEEQDLLRRRAGASWKSLIETEVGTIGTVQEGSPPVVLPEARTTITELGERTPADAVTTLQEAAAGAREVSGAIESYDLSSSLTGKGFDKGQVLRFLSARDELLSSLTLIREAVLLGVAAARLEVADRAGVLGRAQSLLAEADAAMARFQTHHVEALSAAGINPQQPGLPGLPGA